MTNNTPLAQTRKEREVWEVCEALLNDGVNITYQAVGDRLVHMGYKRGSNSDICRYLKTWKQANGIEPADSSTPPTPIRQMPGMDFTQLKEELKGTLGNFLQRFNLDQDKRLIKLYSHHQQQFDHYLNAINKAREANYVLQKQIAVITAEYNLENQRLRAENKALREELSKARRARVRDVCAEAD